MWISFSILTLEIISFLMERTLSQETEAPLSDDTFDMLVEGLEAEGPIRGDSIFNHHSVVKSDPERQYVTSTQVCPYTQARTITHPYPQCAESMTMNFQIPSLSRTYSHENLNLVPPNPSRLDYPGLHNFSLKFDEHDVITKSMPWTFSTKLNKLMCKVNTVVPVHFNLEGSVPMGAYFRGILVCQEDDSVMVKTCAKHIDELKKNGANTNVTHMLQSNSPSAVYGICSRTGRHSVRFPVLPMQAGVSHQTESFTFLCFSSCLRMNIELIFTLEENGAVLGRRTISVRVCASPGRDRGNFENRLMNKSVKNKYSSDESDHKTNKRKASSLAVNGSQGQNESLYILSTRSKRHYKYLRNILKALHAYEKINSSDLPFGEVVVPPVWRSTPTGRECIITITNSME